MRVVFLIEDSLPNGRVGPELTPTLWSLIGEGGWHPDGGISVLASSTYPNHATFATGVDVDQHRIFTNDIWNGSEFVCSATIGPAVDTIFERARRAGVSTAAITGDFTMVGCMGAGRADISWPGPDPLPEATPTDCLGYAANSAVLEQLANSGALEVDLAYIHLNDPDSTLHRYGPDSPETLSRIRSVDDDLAAVVEMLQPAWEDTVLFVVSDHEQELVDHRHEPIDLAAELRAASLPGSAHNEGTVGIVYEGPGVEQLKRIPAVTDAIDVDPNSEHGAISLVWSDPGRVFGSGSTGLAGQHGSPRTRTQVATVSGGHGVVKQLAAELAKRRPHATEWVPRIERLLGFA